MGRLLVCNDVGWSNGIKDIFNSTGLKISCEDGSVTAYKKRCVNNRNYKKIHDKSVICVGTWTYKEKSGSEGLDKLYKDVFEKQLPIVKIREELLGTYCCVIKSDDYIKIFVDETHTYAMYYYIAMDGRFIITNTYYHIEKFAAQPLDIEILKLIIAKVGLSSRRTVYKNIYRLMENEILEIHTKENKVNVLQLHNNIYTYNFSSYDEMIKHLSVTAEKVSRGLSSASGETLLFATGGADSRLKLALDSYIGKKVRLAYWGGNNVITNGTRNDWDVNNQISEKLNLSTIYFDVSEKFQESLGSIKKDICDLYGEYTTIYANNTKWHSIFEKIHKDHPNVYEIEMGYDPDVFREIDIIENSYKQPYSIEKLINYGFLRSGLFNVVFTKDKELYDLIESDISNQMIGINKRDITLKDAVNIFNFARLDMGSRLVNMINEYYFCCNLLYSKPLWEIALQIPYEYKKDSHISISLINKWKPELLHIPIYSQNHFMVTDTKKMCLRKTRKHALLSWLKPKIMKLSVYDRVYVQYMEKRIFPENESSDEVYEICMSYLRNCKLLDEAGICIRSDVSRKGFDLAALGSVVSLLEFCKKTDGNRFNIKSCRKTHQ